MATGPVDLVSTFATSVTGVSPVGVELGGDGQEDTVGYRQADDTAVRQLD